MKLTFEIQGYTITIDETEEGIVVSAMQGEEEVESFTLDMDGSDDMDDDDMASDDDMGSDDDMSDDMDDENGAQAQSLPSPESKLESFMSFLKRKK